jgi:phage terminase large subunit-like protein
MAQSQVATKDEIDWALMRRVLARESLIAYIRTVAPWFTVEEIHCVIAAHLEALAVQEIDRLMIFMPPRGGKSQMGSVFFPSWYAGKFPNEKILQVGHSSELSRGFSLEVRELMFRPEYEWIFPGVQLAKDAKAAGKWRVEEVYVEMAALEERLNRNQQGQYNAAGVTTGIAGKGFNLGIVDDPMSEQDKHSKITKDRIWNWWGPGFYTRRQPDKNAILVAQTRWARDDLPGHLIEQMEKHHGADVWTILNIPAILDRDSARKIYTITKDYKDARLEIIEPKEGASFAPRRFSQKELARSRANLTEEDWNALYMGNPNLEEGFILKQRHWRLWPKKDMPECQYIFQMYDTALEEKEQNDLSARSTWGVFEYREKEGERPTQNMILLETWEDHVETPDLKGQVLIGAWGAKEAKKALKLMHPQEVDRYDAIPEVDDKGREILGYHPDHILIENKVSGSMLIKELRRIRKPRPLPVRPWDNPRGSRGRELSKFSRAKLASLVLEQGAVWYPNQAWALAVIKRMAETKFDGTDGTDDLADTITASMIYVRKTYRVELASDIDEEEEAKANLKPKVRQFYGARR